MIGLDHLGQCKAFDGSLPANLAGELDLRSVGGSAALQASDDVADLAVYIRVVFGDGNPGVARDLYADLARHTLRQGRNVEGKVRGPVNGWLHCLSL
ncbi:hypothetical protein [Mycobacterium sp. 1465703.0]|uniref:hypothetical protein n=1 Tax=Mycobacterium sp. 1465703.0 TaxID=1834078 RepID=UPI0018D29195|nr:hypothetical protein [Mycobacterium sp. 1465703.0]